MTLMLYTGCRREDVVRLGPQHIKNGRLRYTQAKNENRNPVHIDIPVHDDLAEAIAATSPSGHMTFLATVYGKPFTPAGFGNWFRDRCNEARLSQCSSHGLRKATAARLAERGATSQEIMAITGHRSLSEAERYTKAANKNQARSLSYGKVQMKNIRCPTDIRVGHFSKLLSYYQRIFSNGGPGGLEPPTRPL